MAALIPSRRSERRILQILAAEISSSDESVPKETTVTENVSLHGARVITVWPWQTGTRLLVTFLWDGVRSEGRVTYCQRKKSGGFAIGVELSGQWQAA
ncbi:MAG TPA: PilZ domain-containing protein [Candidatus Acidoferrales bacterium]|nr:PilZ domain-containing protein [Candidatus Acidoferrales bacterium]